MTGRAPTAPASALQGPEVVAEQPPPGDGYDMASDPGVGKNHRGKRMESMMLVNDSG